MAEAKVAEKWVELQKIAEALELGLAGSYMGDDVRADCLRRDGENLRVRQVNDTLPDVLDSLGLRELVAEYAPAHGLGDAINNRLSKAEKGRISQERQPANT